MGIKERNAVLKAQIDILNSLPLKEAKTEAILHLIMLGVLDKDGNSKPYNEKEFCRSNHPINYRRIFNGN